MWGFPLILAGTLTDTNFKNLFSYLWTHLIHISLGISRQEEPGRLQSIVSHMDVTEVTEVTEVWSVHAAQLTHINPNACCYFLSSDLFPDTPWFVFWVTASCGPAPRIHVPLLLEIPPGFPRPHKQNQGAYCWSSYSGLTPGATLVICSSSRAVRIMTLPPFEYFKKSRFHF